MLNNPRKGENMKKDTKKEKPKAMVFGDFEFSIYAKKFPGLKRFIKEKKPYLGVVFNGEKKTIKVRNACLLYARGTFQISMGAYDNEHTFCFSDEEVKKINGDKIEKTVSHYDGFLYAGMPGKEDVEKYARKIGIWK